MNIVSGEKEIARSPDGGVVLTSHRVRYEKRATGQSQLVSITLDAVSSCGLTSSSYPWLLVLAVVAVLTGYYMQDKMHANGMLAAGVVAGILLALVYQVNRRTFFRVSSAGESMAVSVTGTNRDAFVGFIDEVEKAKLEYLGKVPG